MTIEMVVVVSYVRKNPGASKEVLMKSLNLNDNSLKLALAGLTGRGLIKIDAESRVYPFEK